MENIAQGQSQKTQTSHLRPPLLWAIFAILAVLAIWARISQHSAPAGQTLAEISQTEFVEQTGVRVVRLVLTAGGGMLDLRYQVIDPDKAVIVHDRQNPPRIVDEASGQVLSTPWLHQSHNQVFNAGVTYYTLLINSGGVVQPGSLVTVMIGDISLAHVIVQ